MTGGPPDATVRRETLSVDGAGGARRTDRLAVEEPMEVRVVAESGGRRERHSVAVTMRTPGHDFELATGFLFTEGVIGDRDAVAAVRACDDEPGGGNVVEVTLAPGVPFDRERFTRHVYTTSSCGVCGKASLEALRALVPPPVGASGFSVAGETLSRLPARLRECQPVFGETGGLHAAALFDATGEPLLVREDVGRHNALDKVIGALFMAERLPASEALVLVSGRAGFELVQKSAMAGIPLLAAVGAASSLAVEAAAELGMTLVGFVRPEGFNVYAGFERVGGGGDSGPQAAHQ